VSSLRSRASTLRAYAAALGDRIELTISVRSRPAGGACPLAVTARLHGIPSPLSGRG